MWTKPSSGPQNHYYSSFNPSRPERRQPLRDESKQTTPQLRKKEPKKKKKKKKDHSPLSGSRPLFSHSQKRSIRHTGYTAFLQNAWDQECFRPQSFTDLGISAWHLSKNKKIWNIPDTESSQELCRHSKVLTLTAFGFQILQSGSWATVSSSCQGAKGPTLLKAHSQ